MAIKRAPNTELVTDIPNPDVKDIDPLTPIVEPPALNDEPLAKTTTRTNWGALASAKVWPTEWLCQFYRSFHRVDTSCHTRVRPRVENIKGHMNGCSNDIGTSFHVTFEKRDIPCPLWAELEEAGIEALDFRCDVCDRVMPFSPLHILNHMRPHTGKSRKTRPGGKFQFTLSYDIPFVDTSHEL